MYITPPSHLPSRSQRLLAHRTDPAHPDFQPTILQQVQCIPQPHSLHVRHQCHIHAPGFQHELCPLLIPRSHHPIGTLRLIFRHVNPQLVIYLQKITLQPVLTDRQRFVLLLLVLVIIPHQRCHRVNLIGNLLEHATRNHVSIIPHRPRRVIHHHDTRVHRLVRREIPHETGPVLRFGIIPFRPCGHLCRSRLSRNLAGCVLQILRRAVLYHSFHHLFHISHRLSTANMTTHHFRFEPLHHPTPVTNLLHDTRFHPFPIIRQCVIKSQHLQRRNLQLVPETHPTQRGTAPRLIPRIFNIRFCFTRQLDPHLFIQTHRIPPIHELLWLLPVMLIY